MRLAVTRKLERLKILESKAQERQVELVALPMTLIENIPFDWSDKLKTEEIDWLVFSSANGVISFFERLVELGLSVSDKTKIAVIGTKTAGVLKQISGRQADFIPEDSYGVVMFKELVEVNDLNGKTLVYPRAEQIINDPTQFFDDIKLNYVPIICYRSVPQEVDQVIVEQLQSEDYILFTSPSNVRSYQNQFGAPKAKLIAIGCTTAKSMNDIGWSGFITMKKINVDNVLELI